MESKIETSRVVPGLSSAPKTSESNSHVYQSGRNNRSQPLCANEYCTTDPEVAVIRQINFNGKIDNYCEYCSGAINRKWVCPFCYMIFNEHAIYPDKCVWICCDNENCGSWSHVSCESEYGNSNISNLLKNPNYKYMCLSCRNNKSKSKYNNNEANGKKGEARKAEKPMTVDEVRKLMITKKKPVQYNYTYLYSENYQTIEKLLNSCNCGFSLQLNDEQIEEDMKKFKELMDHNESNGKENVEEKGDGIENLEKRSHKRFTQRGVRS